MKIQILVRWLLLGLTTLSTLTAFSQTLSLEVAPASSTYSVGQTLFITVTGGQVGSTYTLGAIAGPAGTPVSSASITNGSGGNTVTWETGQTDATFLVRFLAGSANTEPTLTFTNNADEADATQSGALTIVPAPRITVSPLPTYSEGQSVTVTMEGGIPGKEYVVQLFEGHPYDDKDLSDFMTPYNPDGEISNTIVWSETSTSGQFVVTFEEGSKGTNRVLVVSDMDLTHPGLSEPFSIITCPTTVSIAATPSPNVAPGGSVTLTASGATSYTWSNGQSTTAITVSPTSSTAFSVTGVTGGCSATATARITLCSVTATLGSSSSTVCSGNSVVVSSTVGEGATGYQWYKDSQSLGASQQSPTLSLGNAQVSDQGSYVLVVTGCKSATSTAFVLVVKPSPVVETLSQGAFLLVTGGVLYEWMMVLDRINGYEIRQTRSNTNGIFPLDRAGAYTITVTDGNGCSRTVTGVIAGR